MPDPRQIFLQSNAQQKKRILDENARKRIQQENRLIDQTLAVQAGTMDKIMMSIYHGIKSSCLEGVSREKLPESLSDEEKYDLKLSSRGKTTADEEEKQEQIDKQVLTSIITEPTLEKFRELHFLIGMVKNHASTEIGKERNRVYQSLPPEYEEETKQLLTDTLTKYGGHISHMVSLFSGYLLKDLEAKTFPGQNASYEQIMQDLMKNDIKNKLGPAMPPTMTVREYLDLLKSSPEERDSFLRTHSCELDDNLFDTFKRKVEADEDFKLTVRRKGAAHKENLLNEATFDAICYDYSKSLPHTWMKEGMLAYQKGMTKSEKKDFEAGERIQDYHEPIGFKNTLAQKRIDYTALQAKMLHDNTISTFKTAAEKITSGKRLYMRNEPGFSAAISANIPKEKLAERIQLTTGALSKLQGIGSNWEHHSSDSAKYTKLINALKAYNEALLRGDGGKILDTRKDLVKYGLAYVDGKESKRRYQSGQNRYDIITTLLYEELKEAEFAKIIAKINNKRSEAEKVSVNTFENRKNSYITTAKEAASAAQQQSMENRGTNLNEFAVQQLSEMDDLYAPEQKDPEEPLLSTHPAISRITTENEHKLSVKDYSALAFSTSLCSSKRAHLSLDEDILMQNNEAVADGKRAVNNALNDYAEGDKVPLATLMKLGIQMINKEASNQYGNTKNCLQEMADRMVGMLDRDPELKKYAMQQGLKAEDIKAAREINAPKFVDLNNERRESLGDLQL